MPCSVALWKCGLCVLGGRGRVGAVPEREPGAAVPQPSAGGLRRLTAAGRILRKLLRSTCAGFNACRAIWLFAIIGFPFP